MINLNGWSMSRQQPRENFHQNELIKKNQAAKAPFGSVQTNIERNLVKTISRTPEYNICGYLLEFVLEYTSHTHEKNTSHFSQPKEQVIEKLFHGF